MTIECQLIKRISNGDDQGIVRDICMPRNDSQRRIVIACCQDFSALLDTAKLCANFQTLYDMFTWAFFALPDQIALIFTDLANNTMAMPMLDQQIIHLNTLV